MENIIDEANRCLSCKVRPCSKACPLGNDIPSFIKQVKENNLEEAFKILTQTTVLGAICGRVCPHFKQCMGSCVRGIKSEPINIGNLETYIFDNALQKNYKIETTNKIEGKKVAVIGGGPSGLTCAAFLSMNGAKVTIYEKQPKLGGITRYGIPDFRLPREVIDKTVEKILSLGIEAKCNQTLGKDYELEKLYPKLSEAMQLPINKIRELVRLAYIRATGDNVTNEDGEEGDIIGGIPSNIDIEGMFINEENKKQVLDKIEKVFNSLQDRQKSLISDILTIKLWLDLDETDEKYSFINKDAIKEWKKSGVLPTQREIAGKYERNEASVSRTVKDFQKKLKKEL